MFTRVRPQLSQMQTKAGILLFLPQPAVPTDCLINGRSACWWKNVCPQLNFLCFQPTCFFSFLLRLILNKGPVKMAIKYALCCCILYLSYRNKNTDSTRLECPGKKIKFNAVAVFFEKVFQLHKLSKKSAKFGGIVF